MNKKSSSKKFNELVKLLEGNQVEVLDIKEPNIRHPFYIMPSWQNYTPDEPEKAVSVFTLEPAFCSSKEIKVNAKGKYCSKATEERLNEGKLKDEKFYSAYLSERPKIVTNWRQIGGEADNADLGTKPEKVPDTFLKMGVEVGATQKSNFTSEGRKLFVTDIWIQHDRWTTDIDVTFGDPFASASVADYSIKYTLPPMYSSIAHVHSGGPFVPRSTPRSVFEKMLGVTAEAWDALLVGKIWAVSPPVKNKVFTPKPSPAYQIIEEQMLFYNVNYLAPELAPLPPKQNLTLRTGLLFGIADAIFNSMLAWVNDTTNQAANALVALENRKGKFFTI